MSSGFFKKKSKTESVYPESGSDMVRGDMSYLLFPGRHLVNTAFQAHYLHQVLSQTPASLPGFLPGISVLEKPPTEILFAITSANQENSRFNPIPFHIRAIGVDRFARQVQATLKFRYRIFGIPHYGHTKNFATFTIKEIAFQSEQTIPLKRLAFGHTIPAPHRAQFQRSHRTAPGRHLRCARFGAHNR